MPIFLYWSLPLIVLFLVCVVFKAEKFFLVLSFLLAYSGMLVTFIRSVKQSKNSKKNKKTIKQERYF